MMTVQRRVYVISDLHLGGRPGDPSKPGDRGFRICTHTDDVAAFVERLAALPIGPERTELVINGDVVDFLAEETGDTARWEPFISDGNWAAETLDRIITTDRRFFTALGGFVRRGHRLVILLGNHDVELLLPAVRRAFSRAIGLTGSEDFEFVDGAEAYVCGDALIEHGNRYDEWNVVDHVGLMKLRAYQSRKQPMPDDVRFAPSAGSEMVSTVINPLKREVRFVDLLKPEIGAVVPMLLATYPASRKYLTTIAQRRKQAARHRLRTAAVPAEGDVANLDIATDPLREVLAETLNGDVEKFLTAIGDSTPVATLATGVTTDGDIASLAARTAQVAGIGRLLLTRGAAAGLTNRLPALLMALRALKQDRCFDRSVETMPEYENASRALVANGFRVIVFGHTHLARDVDLGNGARYLNSGTWADLMTIPPEIVGGPEDQALAALADLAADLAANRLNRWVRFAPTYVRLTIGDDDKVVDADLCDYVATNPF